MSKRATKKGQSKAGAKERTPAAFARGGREARGEGEASAFYVYCVGERDALALLFEGELPEAIEAGAALELVGAGELAAVVSAVPLGDYGEGALAARLSDAAWTATRALRHERVAEHFARRASVVPLRFGAIYLEREGVARMLSERGGELRAVLARVGGREEWGLNVYVEPARLREEVTRVSARLRELSARADASAPGQAYLLRKKIESLRDEEARAETRRAAAEVGRRLADACEASARLRVLKDEATEQGELAARLAFLVRREGFDAFRAAAESLAADYAPLGFRFELTGPWPPYNFSAADEERQVGNEG